MKKLNSKLLLSGLVGLLFVVSSCETQEGDDLLDASAKKTALSECETVVDLVAGRDHQHVGYVHVNVLSENSISVTYSTEGNWLITESHIQVFTDNADFSDVPTTKKGSPKIGKFDYKAEHEFVSSYTEVIEFDVENLDYFYVAAHAVVTPGINGVEGLESLFPLDVKFIANFPGDEFESTYFDIVVSGGTPLDKTYDGYCIDPDRGLTPGTQYDGTAYSSYTGFPEDLVEKPENFDLVNWILNQEFTAQYSDCAGRDYTFGDVNLAIWMLIDDNTSTIGLREYNECAAEEIVAIAMENGEGFVPGCGDKFGVVIDPVMDIQSVIFAYEVPCDGDETAWGKGLEFPGKDWSMYFEVNSNCDFE